MKVRFDGLDVQAMVAFLQRTVLGRRVVNIYDGDSGDAYVLKLEGDVTDNNKNKKEFLWLESGIRFHMAHHFSPSNPMPSPFASKLRKHLRSLRLEKVSQIGTDRVVLFQFGVGPSKHALILELYAKGNLILTDKDYTILALLRSHVYQNEEKKDDEEKKEDNGKDNKKGAAPGGVAVQVGQVYPVTYATSLDTTTATKEDAKDSEGNNENQEAEAAGILGMTSSQQLQDWITEQVQATVATDTTKNDTTSKKSKKNKKQQVSLKTLLLKKESGVFHFGPALIEHCILFAELDPHKSLVQDENGTDDSEKWSRLLKALQEEGPAVIQALQDASMKETPGYILYKERDDKNKKSEKSEEQEEEEKNLPPELALPHADKILEEFQPHLLKQHESRLHIQYDNFSAAVDDFFAHLVRQKVMLRAQAAETAAADRLEKVKQDQKARIQALEREQEALKQHAQIVQMNADDVDKALTVINSALDSGMDWDQLEQVIDVEQNQNKNPIALLIRELDLEHDAMVLRLPTVLYDENSEKVDVKILLKETAHANANRLFEKYRVSKEKSQKTIEASTKALKAAEETAKRQLAEAQKRSKQSTAASTAMVQRKSYWFEKFHWFITSDNYLVVGGRDAHQNEMLVKRYLRPGDAYLHADVHGAASCILRAKRRRQKTGGSQKGRGGKNAGKTEVVPLSEQALREAGNFTICHSSAWTSRMITSAWWVESHQVSKTAPSGEYLTVGSFMIRGKKNFLPPSQLEMGIAVLFRLGDDDSIARHKNERRDFALIEMEDNESEFEDDEADDIKTEAQVSQEEKQEDNFPSNNDDNDSPPEAQADDEVEGPHSESKAEEADGGSESDDDNEDKNSDEDESNNSAKSNGGAEENQDVASQETKPQKKRGLSARDRKLIKKYGSLEEANRVLEARSQEETSENKKQNRDLSAVDNSSKQPQQQGNAKRGKRGKHKKAMKKYADQDEEDRRLAVLALQGGEKKKKKGSKTAKVDTTAKQKEVAAETASLLVKDPAKIASELPSDVQQVLAKCVTVRNTENGEESEVVRWDKFDADTLEQLMSLEPSDAQLAAANRLLNLKQSTRLDNFSASLGGIIRTIRKYGHGNLDKEDNQKDGPKRKGKNDKDTEAMQWKQTMEEEGIVENDFDDDAVDDTIELSKLTGKPHPEDLILYCVPVCGPYSSLHQYAYRVKLTPGNLKRGKASKQCVEMFLKADKSKTSASQDKQLDLIKRVSDNDWVQVICANTKISAAGASKTTKQNKSKKSKKG